MPDTPPTSAALEREMRTLELRMLAMPYSHPGRQAVVDRYNAVCDQLGIPTGDKDDLT